MTLTASSGGSRGRWYRQVGFAVLVSVFALGAGAQQPQTAADWIGKARSAGERQSFVANVVYEQGSHIEALRLWRDLGEDAGLRERLISLSGPQREILRTEEKTTYLTPSASAPLAQRYAGRSIDLPGRDDISRLDRHYQLYLEGDGRVADRPAQRVRMLPRDEFRYGYALWLERQTGVVLRADVIDKDSAIVERFLVVDLELRDQLTAEALAPVLAEEGTSFDALMQQPVVDETRAPVQSGWSVTDLPGGFRLQSDQTQMLARRETPVRHMVFSDGMATVSIYIGRHDTSNPLEGPMSMGGVNIHARNLEDVQTLVVGQVPAATVRRISTSLVRESESNATGQ